MKQNLSSKKEATDTSEMLIENNNHSISFIETSFSQRTYLANKAEYRPLEKHSRMKPNVSSFHLKTYYKNFIKHFVILDVLTTQRSGLMG